MSEFPPVSPTQVRSSRHVAAVVTVEGAMLLDLRGRGRWFTLPPSGALWWQSLAEGATAEQAADAVADHYRLDRRRVRADIAVLIGQLLSCGLLDPITTDQRRWRWWQW